MQKELILCGITLCGSILSLDAAPKADKRPNVLFCIADDAAWLHFGAYGCKWVKTPVFDRVAAQGVVFDNCYTPNAKSAPSRAILLTGLYPWQLGPAGNHICHFPEDVKVFTEVLSESDYDVAFTGKGWAPGNPGVNKEGEERLLTGVPYQSIKRVPPTPDMLPVDYVANFNEFLSTREDSKKPWFFWFGCREPHRRYEYGSGLKKGGFRLDQIDAIPQFWPDNEAVRTDLLDYAFELEDYDRQLGRMLELLEEKGELDNTIVIVTSDNGMPFPRAKGTQYEYGHHMPLAIMWKDGLQHPGRREQSYVSFVDLAPTMLEVAQVAPSESGMQPFAGASILPLLRDEHEVNPLRERVLLGRERHDNGRPMDQGYPIRGMVRDGWLYICNLKPWLLPGGNPETGYRDIDSSPTKTSILELHRSGENHTFYEMIMGVRPYEELYHVAEDKECMYNKINEPNCRKLADSMRQELMDILREQNDPRLVGDGNIFDHYPYDKAKKAKIYEKVVSGGVIPWKESNWVAPTDYEQYYYEDKLK